MRQIGILNSESSAQRFAAYLITQGVAAQADRDGQDWAIWVRDEDHVLRAKKAFHDFLQNPDAPEYHVALREAQSVLQQEVQRRAQARRNLIDVRRHWGRVGARKSPLVKAIIVLSIVVFFLTGFGNDHLSVANRMLSFCDVMHHLAEPTWDPDRYADRLVDVTRGQAWRLVTPVFLHANLLHLVFNMVMFHALGSRIEDRRGTARLGWLVLVVAVVSNAAQALAPSDWGPFSGGPFFLGMSGVVYGLLGYLWMKTLYEPDAGLNVSGSTVVILLVWLVVCLFGLPESGPRDSTSGEATVQQVANMAHLMGLVAGTVVGYAPVLWRAWPRGPK